MPSNSFHKLYLNTHLLTIVNGELEIVHDAALAVCDNKIAWLGTQKHLQQELSSKDLANFCEQMVDLNGDWITPGFIDCHTHLVYAGDRREEHAARRAGTSYEQIAAAGGGILSTVNATRAASEQELYQQSAARVQQCINNGVKVIEIKSGYGLDLDTELKMLRVARQLGNDFDLEVKTTFLGAHTVPPEFEDADRYIEFICNEVLPAICNEHLADAVDIFCEHLAFDCLQAEKVLQAAAKYDLPVKMHAEQFSNMGGARLAARYNALSVDHLEYADETTVKAIAASGTVAVLLPGAYHFLQETQKPPVELLRQHNVPIAIATDCNPGTSPTTDLRLMLKMSCELFDLTLQEAIAGVTYNAAKALGMQSTHGSLQVGKNASLSFWKIDKPADLVYTL